MWEILNIFNPEKALETSEEDWLTDLAKRDELASGTVLWVVSVKKKKKK